MPDTDYSLQIHQQFQQIYVLLDDGDRRVLRTVGLTPTQYRLLQQLAPQTAKALTITQLSQVLLCTRGNITRLVRRMEQQGLVHCGADERDQRLVKVSLTPTGAARLEQAQTIYAAAIRRRLGVLDPDIQQKLHTIAQQVSDRLIADLAAQPPLPEGADPDEADL